MTLTLDDIATPAPKRSAADWNEDGVVILPGLIDDDRIRAYDGAWAVANGCHHPDGITLETYGANPALLIADRPGGWPDCTPYMRHPEILDLVAPLAPHLEQLIGEPAGMHLNLTGWVTTTRDWHQDSYLNPPHVGDRYAAVWIALGDIHPDSGPFQYVPGSHRWPQVSRAAIWQQLGPAKAADPRWPAMSEEILTPVFTREIAHRRAEIVTHLPRRGDVLIWHGRLLHRGSHAHIPGAYRPAFIAHFSGVHRQDMPTAVEHPAGGWYFPITGGPV